MTDFFGAGVMVLYAALIIGWVLNLIIVIQAATGPMAVSVVRLVGVGFVPLGGVIGWVQ